MKPGFVRRPHVLVVDDSAFDCVRLIEAVRDLAGETVGVSAETHPERALRRVEATPFDVVFADAGTGPVTGMDVLAHAWAFRPASRRILLTGRDAAAVRLDGLQKDIVDDVQRKPPSGAFGFVRDVLADAGLVLPQRASAPREPRRVA